MNELSPTLMLAFLHTMKGQDFLGLFFVWFLVTFLTVVFVRTWGHDTPFVTAVGLISFELLAVARIVVGSFYGMQRWGLLIVMMIVGAFFFLIRGKHFEGTGGDSGEPGGTWWSSDSGSGSSGGGGCGGGGGGCGGCGGGGD